MKNMGKKIRYIAFFIGVCVLLAGCGKKFDASGYTKAVLDVSYKNEIQKYVELTGADEKEADKIFEDNLQNNMDIMLQEFSGYELPDELEEKYRKLFSDMMKQVKYTVAEAKEVENKNFTVDVKVEPMLIFNDTYQELQKQTEDYATQVSNEVMNGASLPSETDMQTHVFEIYHDILRNYLDQGMKYGDPETITVHVNKDDKNVYKSGTTLAMMAPSITEVSIPLFFNSCVIMIPYSSEVLGVLVMIRKVAASFSPQKTPMVILVLPTSMTNIIRRPPHPTVPKHLLF